MSSDVHVVPSIHTATLMRRLDDLEPQTLSWLLALLLVLAYTCVVFISRAWSHLQARESGNKSNSPSDPLHDDVSAKGGSGIADLLYTECQGDDVTAEQYDAIIVGAGVAGAALAYTLGKNGRRVLVLERDLRQPDRIVGELLQPGGYLKLQELGLADCVEGIDSQTVDGYVIFKGQQEAKLQYPPLEDGPEAGQLVAGRGFHNGRFVQAMRRKAASLPGVTLVEATVTGLVQEGELVRGVKFKQKPGANVMCACDFHRGRKAPGMQGVGDWPQTLGDSAGGAGEAAVLAVHAPLTFVCDGCFSNLRRSFSHSKIQVPSSFVGLLLKDCPLPHPHYGHVVIADPSPVLFYPISATEVRCLVDVPGKVPSAAQGELQAYLLGTVCPQLPEKLRGPFQEAVEGGDIRMMPNRIMPAVPVCRQGALLMGDAFNMRHPLTGGGMTVALSDIAVLAQMLSPLPDFSDTLGIQNCASSFFMRRKPIASTINTLACALHQVFCASPDPAMTEMRQACFDYLALGGVCASGPVSLLSGLNQRPLSLVFHFFAVAFFGVSRLLFPFPTLANMLLGVNLVKMLEGVNLVQVQQYYDRSWRTVDCTGLYNTGASEIIFPIIRAEGFFRMFFPSFYPSYHMAQTKPRTRS